MLKYRLMSANQQSMGKRHSNNRSKLHKGPKVCFVAEVTSYALLFRNFLCSLLCISDHISTALLWYVSGMISSSYVWIMFSLRVISQRIQSV